MKLTNAQIKACDELIAHLIKQVPERAPRAGYFSQDIFCDGGSVIMIVKGLSDKKHSELKPRLVKDISRYTNFLNNLDKEIIFKSEKIIDIEDLKFMAKREKYAAIQFPTKKLGVFLYSLRRILMVSQGKIELMRYALQKSENSKSLTEFIIFRSLVNDVIGCIAPTNFVEDVFPVI